MSDILAMDEVWRPYHMWDSEHVTRSFDIQEAAAQLQLSEHELIYAARPDMVLESIKRVRRQVQDFLNRNQVDPLGETNVEFVIRGSVKTIDRAAGLDESQRRYVARSGVRRVVIAVSG